MKYTQYAEKLKSLATNNRHRYCVVVSGEKEWGRLASNEFCTPYQSQSGILISNDETTFLTLNTVENLELNKVRGVLGREFDFAVYDSWSGFDPDALGIVAGTITAGGLLILITPGLESWAEFADPQYSRIIAHGNQVPKRSHYIKRLANFVHSSDNCVLMQQGCTPPNIEYKQRNQRAAPDFSDQKKAISNIKKVLSGQRKRPIVLLSDRGRGKSASLGIAAGQMIREGLKKIAVTGLNYQSVECVFKHIQLEGISINGRLQFFPADKLIDNPKDIDLLLVDEAASIPLSMLEKLLDTYPRIAFASTVHGYEGTGRGFMLRFQTLLDNKTRGWNKFQMTTPIRWAENDPLERFTYDALLLNAESEAPEDHLFSLNSLKIEIRKATELAMNEKLLRDIFGLLVQSHYRTRPFDLRHFLDGQNLTFFTIAKNSEIFGVAIVAEEGNFDDDLAKKIWANKSRPNGHLLPQQLCAQQGFLEAARLKCARIMRIVVTPEFRHRGIGTKLLEGVVSHCQDRVDFVGASFGIDFPVLKFWQNSAFVTVRIGHSQSQNTGTHPCTLVKAITSQGGDLIGKATDKFSDNFGNQLSGTLNKLDPDLVPQIFAAIGTENKKNLPGEQDFSDLVGFAFANQNMDNIRTVLREFSELMLSRATIEDPVHAKIIVERILQEKPWKSCTALPQPRGKKQGTDYVRKAFKEILIKSFPEKVYPLLKQYDLNIKS